jgi:NitT/TauT family transport system substrate-binding protein
MPGFTVGVMIAAAAMLLSGRPMFALDQVIVTEPNHVVGYLPLYVTQRRGFFAEEGIEVKWTTIETGSGPTNALLTGQAFAMLGGPEHNAYAKIKGADLRAIGGVLIRSSAYVMAAKGQEPANRPRTDAEWAGYFKGKAIGAAAYGSTPNSVMRFLLRRFGLDAKGDVQLIEIPGAAILAAAKAGRVQLGVLNEPLVTQGIRNGIWGEPIYNVPAPLGPYAWATVNVRADTIVSQPLLVERFVRALVKGLKATYSDRAATITVAQQEFPTMAVEDLTAAIERCQADEVWSKDGFVDPAAWTMAQNVVRGAGLLAQEVPYADAIDMRFVQH